MSAKEYLQRAKCIASKLNFLKMKKEIIYTELMGCTVLTDRERVDGTRMNSRELKQAELCDITDKIECFEIRLLVVKTEINNVIGEVPDDLCRAILLERYINFKKWNQISQAVHYSKEHIIQKLHPKALGYIENLLNDRKP